MTPTELQSFHAYRISRIKSATTLNARVRQKTIGQEDAAHWHNRGEITVEQYQKMFEELRNA